MLARVAGRSQGAVAVSFSSVSARVTDGSQRRGGAATSTRGVLAGSAAIIAVSARNHCSLANAAACRIWVRTLAGIPAGPGTTPGISLRRSEDRKSVVEGEGVAVVCVGAVANKKRWV